MNPAKVKPQASAHDPAVVQKHLDDGAKGNPGRPIPDVPLAQHVNQTPFPSQYFQSVDADATVFHVVVLRVTYDMHRTLPDGSLAYAAEQTPLATNDQWSGPVNESSPLWESDYVPHKPKCDVLVANAVSRPPRGQSAQRWPCGVALQWQQDGLPKTWVKQIGVTGPRRFGLMGLSQSEAVHEVPISWQHAFGGQIKQPLVDERSASGGMKKAAGSSRWDTDERNPVGVGLNKAMGQPGPQLEAFDKPYTDAFGQGDYPPACLSAVGKAWLPRRTLAGTYDEAWHKNQWPLPPLDFDDGYWNCAPQDQQVDYLPPGTLIALKNLYPPPEGQKQATEDDWQGRLPEHHVSVRLVMQILGQANVMDHQPMNLDTLVIDAAAQRIYATYRYAIDQAVFTGSVAQIEGLTRLETRLHPPGQPFEIVAPDELGPLGRLR